MSTSAPTMRDTIERTGKELDAKASADSGSVKETPEKVSRGTESVKETGQTDAGAAAVTDDDPLGGWAEAPPWMKRWSKDAAKALRGYATDPNNGENWKHVGNELNKLYSDWGKQANEVGQLRGFASQYAPVHDMLQQRAQQWQMQGMNLQGGLGQVFAYMDALQQNPDATLLQLAQMYKPRDAGKFLASLAQATGADLNQIAQGQPYIDPAVTQVVNPLMQRLQGLEQMLGTAQQQATQAQQEGFLRFIDQFENAKDADGSAMHPYLREPEFFPMVIYALQSGVVPRDLSAAYRWAEERYPPAIQKKAEAAQKLALAKAAETTANSNTSRQASNNLQSGAGRSKSSSNAPNSIREAIRQTAKAKGETIPSHW